ncbi:ABC transporter substrate-binding protein [Chitinibacter fontanus]|uniref:ABC transporter substrate-binding protein n=1 Tax=Chitinibacter fontanus TaxID=1737446 RepID=A0A7D5VAV3_9NEIS|nr:ABC transporter substrate-binding protein [Chitinibacter fontanus]QLI82234.1 ABC transporter substrate-binding protein [Chitinibacter fontanus]
MLKKLIIAASLALVSQAYADITIGQSVPTTGLAAETGKAMALGASIYFNQVNGRGGVNGELINHVVRDDAGNPQTTVKNAQDFIEKENATALISFYGTDNIAALIKSKVLDTNSVPLVGVHTGADSLRNPGSPYIFHTRASYTQEIDRLVKLLNENLGVTKFGVLAQQGGFGDAGVTALKASLAKKQLKIAGEAWYDGKTGDSSKAAAELAKINPEAVILVAVTKPAATFVQEYKNHGGTSQIYALSAVQFEEVGKQIGKKTAHGLGISQVMPYPYNTRARVVQEFQDDVYAELGSGSSGKKESLAAIAKYPSYAMLEGYIAARIVVEGIKRAGKAPSRAAVYNALTTLNRFDLGGFVVDYNATKRAGSNFGELTMISPTGALTR